MTYYDAPNQDAVRTERDPLDPEPDAEPKPAPDEPEPEPETEK